MVEIKLLFLLCLVALRRVLSPLGSAHTAQASVGGGEKHTKIFLHQDDDEAAQGKRLVILAVLV